MAYTVNDGLQLAQKLAKGVPFTSVDTTICDIVSATMYKAYPWRDTLKASPDNWTEVTLTDGNQDFATGLTDIFRMTQFWVRRSDVTPNKVNDIRPAKSLPIDLQPKSPAQVRAAAYQAGVNKFRLETAVRIPAGTTWKIGGEYQPQHTQITGLESTLWFQDEYLDAFVKGLIYWAYRIADDSRAGAAQKVENGKAAYTGALAEFMDAIDKMAAAEDFGNIDIYYPDNDLGAVDGRRWYANDTYPYLLG